MSRQGLTDYAWSLLVFDALATSWRMPHDTVTMTAITDELWFFVLFRYGPILAVIEYSLMVQNYIAVNVLFNGMKCRWNNCWLLNIISFYRNFGHVLMSGIFMYWFWATIAILFITGTQNINFYCLGYLVCCFYFFWHGLDFTIRKKRTVFLRM